ncbi:AcvB/VirJ family lysyl-phosphatidylglycerol hydrolase [Luteolibacter soli]|uniref:AcvB/VirJ family lysyl-phosphatidylglycerol hydrolase n=1 Tax=Luteolibacter soli TaxID=3135280 RepID=A0ABU9AXV1_9BACT
MKGKPKSKWRRVLWLLLAVVVALLVKFILHLLLPRNVAASGEMLHLNLAGGPFDVPCFTNGQPPIGIVIVGTGDGGWSYWEENTAKHLMEKGYAVGGWDCRKFADTRKYGQKELEEGFNAAVAAVIKRTHSDDDIPVWYGGWSTGAEQSVAAATSPDRPENLVGLLLAAPGTHARYGITTGDLLGADPSGPDTFALEDMAKKLSGVAVAQFAAGLDPMDDTDWIERISVPHRIFKLPGKPHDMGGAGPDFQAKLDEAIAWTLETRR